MLRSRYRFVAIVFALLFLMAGSAVVRSVVPENIGRYFGPTIASILVFAVFSVLLYEVAGDDIFADIGFLYVAIITAYTVIPAAGFTLAEFDPTNPLGKLFPDAERINIHLWRHVLFQFGVAAGYLVLRRHPHRAPKEIGAWRNPARDGRTIVFLAVLIGICVATTMLMSAPVESYYDHFVRYNQLPWLAHKFVSLTIRLSLGLYCVLLVFLFLNYRKYKWVIPVVVVVICTHEIVYSFGARIQAFIVLLQAVCLYHFTVRRVSVKAGFIVCLVIAAIFSVVEVIRQYGGDLTAARTEVADEGFKPASEFGAVFFPGFHLYEERARHSLPPVEWPMFFSDAVSLVTFGDYTRYNPMAWYTVNYYPDFEVAPFTMGPIADSALWGGEPDLLIRGLLNGLFFAYIMRWFLRRRHKWWGLSIYAYCYATCILTLKYSVFLDLNLIEKNLVPTLLLVYVVRATTFSKRRSASVDSGLARVH